MTPFHVFCNSEPNIVEDPKFAVPPIRKKGAANSCESCAQPGCHWSTDAARKWSVTSQTKKPAGTNAVASIVAAYLRIGAPRKISGHIFGCEIRRPNPERPSLRVKSTINSISLGRSRTRAKIRTTVRAINVWMLYRGIDAYRESAAQKGRGPFR